MNLSYRIGWTCFRLMYATYFRWRVYGAENVPDSGGVILASNHASFLDPPLVGSGLSRGINYLARESLFRYPGVGALLRSWSAVPMAPSRTKILRSSSAARSMQILYHSC